jgi:DNA sulfur modification protein DndC
MKLYQPDEIQEFIDKGAIFYVSHFGGKDSQAMYALLRNIVPSSQLVVVHANLGEVEWQGVMEHIRENTQHPVNVVRRANTSRHGGKSRHVAQCGIPTVYK